MNPLISVVIPTHNGVRHICETLDSVFAQTWPHLDVIVVDDASTDETSAAVAAHVPAARLLRIPKSGHPAARNAGIRAARGTFLAFVDHDDLWAPGKLTAQMKCFKDDPALDLVFGHIQNFFSPELTEAERTGILSPMTPLPGLLQGAMLAKRSSFERVGPFNEERDMGDFLDWYGRATLLDLKTTMLPETLLLRRLHASNFQRTHKHRRQQYLPVLKELLDKRRQSLAALGEPSTGSFTE